jgi:hypothetical protein
LTPPAAGRTVWTQTILYAFSRGGDQLNPGHRTIPGGGLYRDRAGGLFGTTPYLGNTYAGTAFQLSPPSTGDKRWAEATLANFGGSRDGSNPSAGLIRDPITRAFYGVTAAGGIGCLRLGCGTVFSLTPPAAGKKNWTETVLHSFGASANDGKYPQARLAIDAAGNLYGTTVSGGADGHGTAFKLSR